MSAEIDNRRFKLRPILSGLLTAAGAVVAVSTLLGFGGRWWWLCDLFANFRVQYLLSLALISPLLIFGRKFRAALLYGAFAAINLALIAPYYASVGATRAAGAGTPLRAVTINVNTANQRYDLVRQFVLENSPDFLLLVEVDAKWLRGVAEIERLYPHVTKQARDDNFGIALYSKRECRRCEIVYLGDEGVPSVVGEFEIEGQPLTIVGTHPLPPKSGAYSSSRDRQLAAIGDYLANVGGARMLLGDLNATPWTYPFRKLLVQAALTDSSRGRGLHLTWLAGSYLWRIPIDHCLVSSEIEVAAKKVGRAVGSDHYPLLVDFRLN